MFGAFGFGLLLGNQHPVAVREFHLHRGDVGPVLVTAGVVPAVEAAVAVPDEAGGNAGDNHLDRAGRGVVGQRETVARIGRGERQGQVFKS